MPHTLIAKRSTPVESRWRRSACVRPRDAEPEPASAVAVAAAAQPKPAGRREPEPEPTVAVAVATVAVAVATVDAAGFREVLQAAVCGAPLPLSLVD